MKNRQEDSRGKPEDIQRNLRLQEIEGSKNGFEGEFNESVYKPNQFR